MIDLLEEDVWRALPASLSEIVRTIDELRRDLAFESKRPLTGSAELQLLSYRVGGRYARHVDDGVATASRPVRRSISLLLYLTPDDWDPATDGGVLRIHAADDCSNSDAVLMDLAPTAGTLVLFDSATVPHEVLSTNRPRTAIVGWLLEER
jgi:Rps23 Pro-64 3,4-dihydroxylase Tpa1-like proline 4-hydroxylase